MESAKSNHNSTRHEVAKGLITKFDPSHIAIVGPTFPSIGPGIIVLTDTVPVQ